MSGLENSGAKTRALELRDVSRIYPQTAAGLAPMTVRIAPSEWVTLLGPSGSGKSTLLRLVAGLEAPDTGTLQVPIERRRIGVVFQDPALLPWKNVIDNICLPLTLRRGSTARELSEARERAEPWIQKLRLKKFLHSFPSELSGGLKMRVSLARALITEPQLLLLDEPFAALDEPIRIELGLELRELWQQLRPTILMVTHSITEGLWLADRVLVLQGQPGRVALDQKLDFGIERPLSLRGEAAFLGQVQTCFELLRGREGKGEP